MRRAVAVAGLIAAAWACAPVAQRDPLATRGGWEAGLQGATYKYEEPGLMNLKGERIGASGAYTFIAPDYVHTRIETRYSYGELDYTGSGTLNDVPDHLFELRALVGNDFRAGNFVWVPYAGLGLRYLYDDLRGITNTGAIGYRRLSRYWYVPVGVTLRFALGDGWVMAPQIEYDAFANGKQRSYLGDTGIGFNDITNRQRRGRGYRVQLMFEGRRWSFGPWMHYWKIKDSEIQPIGLGFIGWEPGNWTRESGVELRYRF